jgi:hypothetical protein
MTEKSKPAAAQRIEVEPIFGEFVELEHVCYLLHEQAKVADAPAGHPVHENGPVRLLRQRVRKQWDGQANEIEAERPGLFDRTYLAGIYREADALLALIDGHPAALPDNLARLELLMHKLYILPLRDFDEVQRELKRAAKAVEDARQEGVKSEKDAQSTKASRAAKASHSGRTTQQQQAVKLFLEAPSQFTSLSAAAQSIVPEILKMTVSRPVAKTNAQRTVTEWLRAAVVSDEKAAAKLTSAARARLKIA